MMEVYLDNSATTRPTDEVVSAMVQAMREGYYNPSALYAPAMRAEHAMEEARRALAQSVGAKEDHVLFTSGGTESDNLAIFGYAETLRNGGDILYTAAEHAAVKNACREAEHRYGVTAREIPLLSNGSVDLGALEAMLGEQTRMLCVMQVCNETGVIMPLAEICALRDRLAPKAAIHVDGVQGYLREPFSFKTLPVQSYAISGHKLGAPKGVGALLWREGFRFRAQLAGGGQQGDLRSGTENTVGIAGLHAAIAHWDENAASAMRARKQQLVRLLMEALPETTVVGMPADDARSACHILSVAFPPVRAETLLHALEADGVLVGTGSACSSKKGKRSTVLTAMKQRNDVMDGAIRISLCPENTDEDIACAAKCIIAQVTALRRFTRR